jgi:hypothetical protein
MLAVLALTETNMAARYFGISRGENRVTEAAASTGKEIEVAVAVTGTVTKQNAQVLLRQIENYILESADNLVA